MSQSRREFLGTVAGAAAAVTLGGGAAMAHNEYKRRKFIETLVGAPILGYRPRPTARKFHLDGQHRTRFLWGGKQSSKSYSGVAEVVMAITGLESIHTPGALKKFRPPPQHWRHWCEDLTRVAVNILYPIYRKLIPDDMLSQRGRALPGYSRDNNTLYLTNGSSVQFLSYEMAQMKGETATLDGVAFDEPPPEKLYDSQYLRLIVRGGLMIGAMTLDEKRASHAIGWMDRRIRRYGDGPHVAWWTMPTRENIQALMDEAPTQEAAEAIGRAYADAYRSLTEQERAVVFEGEGGWAIGLVFPTFDEDVHAAYDLHRLGPKEVVELARKGYGVIRAALDPGMDDPTAMIWVYTHGKHPLPSYELAHGDHLVYREYKVRGLNYVQHAARLAYLSEGEPIQGVWADPMMWERDKNGGPVEGRAFLKAFRKLGIPVRKGNRNKRVGHNRLGEWLAPREHPGWPQLRFLKNQCHECVDELYGYAWKPENDRTGKRPDETIDYNDHLVDDLRYWAMSWPERQRQRRRTMPMPRHPVTGVPMPNFVDVRRLAHALR